jgi:hypothetical protein
MNGVWKCVLILFCVLTLCVPASATVITFEDAVQGPLASDFYASEGVLFGGPVGANVETYDLLGNVVRSGDWYSPLEMTLVMPGDVGTPGVTDYVSMYNWFGPGNGEETDKWTASTYDLGGNLIETKQLIGDGWLTFGTGAIHKVILDDMDDTAFAMDNFTFNGPTAAPGLPAVALIGAAPIVGGIVRRFRRK